MYQCSTCAILVAKYLSIATAAKISTQAAHTKANLPLFWLIVVYLGAIYLNATINRSQAPRSTWLLIAVFKYDVHNLNWFGELLCSLPSHSSFLIHLQLIVECVHLSLAHRAIYYRYGALWAVQRRCGGGLFEQGVSFCCFTSPLSVHLRDLMLLTAHSPHQPASLLSGSFVDGVLLDWDSQGCLVWCCCGLDGDGDIIWCPQFVLITHGDVMVKLEYSNAALALLEGDAVGGCMGGMFGCCWRNWGPWLLSWC